MNQFRPNLNLISGIVFSGIALLIGLDLLTDQGEGAGLVHLLVEGGALVIALIGAILTFRSLMQVRGELTVARADAEKWRVENRELLKGLSIAIGKQFDDWQLTPAETEIGYLLLKGLSLADIANIRETSERTARDQAVALYRKAGLTGRAELSAFFLEDLLAGEV